MQPARKKLGNYIIIAFFLNVFAILSLGGVCILMVKDIVHNITELEDESSNVSRADDINNKTHEMIFAIHQAIINIDKYYLDYAINIVDDVENKVSLYKAEEESSTKPHNKEEVKILEQMLADFAGLRKEINSIHKTFSETGKLDKTSISKLERHASAIQNQAVKLNKIHFEIINVLVHESHNKMYFILLLYLVSALVGILASVVGYIILTRNTVFPIKNLAFATQKVADGDLSIRVQTKSATEIGALYDSFNVMTERLEKHEKQREEFKLELERQVRERTSELRAANESLRKAQVDLIRMEKIATLGQIATTVNHEIKTPLNSLYMNLQLLTKKINKSELQDDAAKDGMLAVTAIIDSEIVRINEILEEFVKYARFSSPVLKENDLNEVIRNVAQMINQNAEKSNVAIELSLDDNNGLSMIDAKKMTQAILNLCVNAIQAMPDGGRLFIGTHQTKQYIITTIADTGTGISKEDLEKIFDPFFTKKEKGLGFGLSIVQRIIEDQKGWISCFSELGEFTIFEIVLPTLDLNHKQLQQEG
ncbi:MAG: HAMP domain-containing protein [Proteobacteria bacterium]|nr:HAMP domain-containing protein [Pseudomonadota bacterium]MBU1710729.1 HAMP domain-containing protein [Pseudomonadota bacterium]